MSETEIALENQKQALGLVAALVLDAGLNPLSRDGLKRFRLEPLPEPESLQKATKALPELIEGEPADVAALREQVDEQGAGEQRLSYAAQELDRSRVLKPTAYAHLHVAGELTQMLDEYGIDAPQGLSLND